MWWRWICEPELIQSFACEDQPESIPVDRHPEPGFDLQCPGRLRDYIQHHEDCFKRRLGSDKIGEY